MVVWSFNRSVGYRLFHIEHMVNGVDVTPLQADQFTYSVRTAVRRSAYRTKYFSFAFANNTCNSAGLRERSSWQPALLDFSFWNRPTLLTRLTAESHP